MRLNCLYKVHAFLTKIWNIYNFYAFNHSLLSRTQITIFYSLSVGVTTLFTVLCQNQWLFGKIWNTFVIKLRIRSLSIARISPENNPLLSSLSVLVDFFVDFQFLGPARPRNAFGKTKHNRHVWSSQWSRAIFAVHAFWTGILDAEPLWAGFYAHLLSGGKWRAS